MIKLIILIIVALFFIIVNCPAEDSKPKGITVVPIFSYAPETRFSLAIDGVAFEREVCDTPYCRPSDLKFTLVGTQNSQYIFNVNPEFITKGKEYILSAVFGYTNYPSKFFGIGNNALATSEEAYTAMTSNVTVNIQRQVAAPSRIGVRCEFWDLDLAGLQQNGQLITRQIPGSAGGKLNSAGITYEYDTRDNVFSASRGAYHELYIGSAGSALGSDYTRMEYEVQLRRYIPVLKWDVLAFEAKFDFNNGTVPFQLMPSVGGSDFLRGYYDHRFMDNNFMGCQAEYRFPVHKLLSISVFGAAGEVADRIEDFRADGIKPAAGAGIRFSLNTEEKIVVRTDYGIGVDSAGLYVKLDEAF